MSNFKPLHEQIAEKLIAELNAGTSPFQKPWTDDSSAAYIVPVNPTTGKNYRGMNALWLGMQNREDPRWMTLKQASYNNWTVEKGAKATLINFVKHTDIRPVLDEKNEPVLNENGKPKTETVRLEKPVITNAWVFNAEQINGIPEWKAAREEMLAGQTWSPLERAEQLVAVSQAVVKHGGNEAYYNPGKDFIKLPAQKQFDSAAKYYATLLHELGHWSGHESRLNRDMGGKFGTEAYAKEELRAEIASLMIGSELNIGHNFGQHAAYVESWIRVLQDDPTELFKASADAQKIADYVLNIDRQQEIKQDMQHSTNPKGLNKDDVISYKETEYKVLAILKGKTAQLEDLGSGKKFKVGPKDGLYTSLINAKNNTEQAIERQPVVEERALAEEKHTETTYSIER
ncbi:ArdC family protein [Mucilaginibacter sp. AW1-7]|jgi:antirestriction protein ArdC|uniref:ArdC family protein n=1 Tax=Mucilaginibacter sp. AW1-7 TaxID=3349874 RepID=UPI003F73ECE2